ncbi:succinyl-CoA:3-ketoacid coenzyme A transferase subunit A [Striga asiatica]|uniref:Succinyl-CoA:3-ketoacid coenzyme A transferase subunit A n=1 Tax=Striga asiatica TaxID=4170 RepID=A0A5A7P944_STRAF|nr:succinyl-CoA:3-ketoacid coenzyme A transferase subunit A [Striga asiatica]
MQSTKYLNWTVGLTSRPDLFQANACSRPKANDFSGHCSIGVMRVPHLFFISSTRISVFERNILCSRLSNKDEETKYSQDSSQRYQGSAWITHIARMEVIPELLNSPHLNRPSTNFIDIINSYAHEMRPRHILNGEGELQLNKQLDAVEFYNSMGWDIPSYHTHTTAGVALTNGQAGEEWNHEQTIQAQAGQGKGMSSHF